MSRAAAALACLAMLLAACGSAARDLFLVTRAGKIPGARLTLRVTDDGFAVCNGGAKRRLSSNQLLDARALERDLGRPVADGVRLAPRAGSILTYRVRTADGGVRFSDTSQGQPGVFYRTAAFAREVAQRVCGLPR